MIGVKHNGGILGLEPDYATLEGDKDLFERHLRSLVNRNWGKDYGAVLFSASFHKVGEAEICVLDVKRGRRPIFLAVSDKNGHKTEKLFVRSGNSSMLIDKVSEIAAYINDRFSGYNLGSR